MNINTAAEEELMILPGVTRCVARNIVEYRTAIGGFRRVEDLALVSGVGATRLQSFKSDITVKRMSSRLVIQFHFHNMLTHLCQPMLYRCSW